MLAAKREELADERCRPRGGLENFTRFRPQFRRDRREVFVENVAVTANRREQIIEIMRHAAGEQTDRFHFLRLEQLLLAFLKGGLGAFALVHRAQDVGEALHEVDGFTIEETVLI